jgi:glycosyltransferase family protein
MAGSFFQKINKYLHYGSLLRVPRRIVKHLLSAVYPLVIRMWPLPRVESIEATILKIRDERLSIARFGDSEVLYVVNQLNLPYQAYDARLAGILKTILKAAHPKVLVGMPDGFRSLEPFEAPIQVFWRSQISFTYPRFKPFLDLTKQYWNANITRLYYGYKDQTKSGYLFELMRSVWADRDVLLIEGEKSRLGVGNDLFLTARSVQRILGPAHHAFSRFDDLKAAAQQHPKDKLVLIAMGPTAKALSYELTLEGYQCVDVGNLDLEYEWYRMGAKERVVVPGKYTSEVAGGRNVADVQDAAYHRQIIARFV